jgi:hypothetical protein
MFKSKSFNVNNLKILWEKSIRLCQQ